MDTRSSTTYTPPFNRRHFLSGSLGAVATLAGADVARSLTTPDNPGTPVTIPGDATPAVVEYDLVHQKLDQATKILNELDIDLWMPVARESDTLSDPILPLILGTSVTWESAFLVSRTGRHRAIVGSGDVENVRQTGAWNDIVGYVEDFGDALRMAIAEYDPETLALDYSIDNFMADGLTHGMYLRLEDILDDTPYWARVVSGEPVSVRVRSRKSAEEQRRIRACCRKHHRNLAGNRRLVTTGPY